ncbi:hypothetical protein [Haloglomus halophilum]|uniref:hypothetical protein n=1 Tax=Haloglomus halophilum TaxID=2962672 RepID=UPI0020C99DB8|nr:hypothetical protein [Haloglomus halophilum]
MSPPSRRSLLGGIATVGLGVSAGCSAFGTGTSRGATDIVLHNEASDPRTVAVLVTQDGDEPRIDTSFEMAPNTRETINNEVLMNADYDVEVTMTGEFADSPYSETHSWQDAGQPLHVIVHEQIVFAVQVG